MKQSGHLNPSQETGTGCPVTSKYGGVGRQQQHPISCIVQPIDAHGGEVMYYGSFCFRGELGFMKCDYIGMCVANKEFELLA